MNQGDFMKKYVLYGIGQDCEIFCYNNKDIIPHIAYCIDQNRGGEKYFNIPVYTLENAPDIHSYTILVTTRWELYKQIKSLLTERNLSEYTDFMWHCCFRKKIVAINMNCYGITLHEYLNESTFFNTHYCIIPTPQIHMNNAKSIDENLIRNCDIYIHQDIRASNTYGYKLSDEYILPKLKPSCRSITVPNLVGMFKFLYPQHGAPIAFNSKHILYRNHVIEEALSKGLRNTRDIKTYHEEYKCDSTALNAAFSHAIKQLQSREKNWDIKLSEYIIKNFQTLPLFADGNHPSKYLYHYIYEQIAIILGLPDYPSHLEHCPYSLPMPMLESIAKHFNLQYTKETDKLNSFFTNKPLSTLSEYINYYCWCAYHINLDEN